MICQSPLHGLLQLLQRRPVVNSHAKVVYFGHTKVERKLLLLVHLYAVQV